MDGRETQRRKRRRAAAGVRRGAGCATGAVGRFVDAFAGADGDVCVCVGAGNVEYIVQKQGMGDIERILDRLAAGTATEQAVREVLHDDYADLMQATAEYLKKNYGR